MTVRKRPEKLITTSESLLPFIESLPDAVVIVNEAHKIVMVNSRAGEMFDYPNHALEGADLKIIIPEQHRGAHRNNVKDYFQGPHSRPMGAGKRFSGLRADGTEVPVDIMINSIVLEGARVAMTLVRDVTYQRALEDRLTLESLTDEMTGFYNRKYFKTQLDAHFSSFVRSGSPVSLIVLDFDYFKTINDRYGHAAGDKVLIDAGKAIQEELRSSDIGCRIGGEEFAIILPDTQLPNALTFAERIRQRIENVAFTLDGITFHATISIGVASFSSTDESYNSLIKRADNALYAGKAAGRNCVISQGFSPHS